MAYTVETEEPGVKFTDQIGNELVIAPDSPFSTYLLKIEQSDCANDAAYLRITLPNRADSTQLSIVEYDDQ